MSEGESASQSPSGYESPVRTWRNPPPPPELQNNEAAMADIIKGTLISKNWVISILLKLMQEADKHEKANEEKKKKKEEEEGGGDGEEKKDEEGEEERSQGESQSQSQSQVELLEIDEDLEEQLCSLWDMTNNFNVARFLNESKAVSIFARIITVIRAPRLHEISVGILGNMCCVHDLVKDLSENETLMSLIMALLSNDDYDPLTLKETMRLLYTCLSNRGVSGIWIEAIRNNPYAMPLFIYIFKSSTNDELLKSTANAADTLLDLSDDLCQEWASADFVEASLEAVRQVGYDKSDDMAPFLHIFQLMTTTQHGAQALVENGEGILTPLLAYLTAVCDYEIVAIEDHVNCLNSVISIIQLLFTSDSAIAEGLMARPSFFEHLLKVLESLYRTNRHVHDAGLPLCDYALRKHSTDHRQHRHHRHSHRERRSSEKRLDEESGDNEEVKEKGNGEGNGETGGGGDAQVKIDAKPASNDDNTKVERQHSDESKKSELSEKPAMEEGEGDGGMSGDTGDFNRSGMRLLFTLLQDFFQEYFKSLVLDDNSGSTASIPEDEDNGISNPPLFLPVLKCLNNASHKPIAYLITTLVRKLAPESGHHDDNAEKEKKEDENEEDGEKRKEDEGEERGEGGGDAGKNAISEKGLKVAEHLLDLCQSLRLSRAARIVRESLSYAS